MKLIKMMKRGADKAIDTFNGTCFHRVDSKASITFNDHRITMDKEELSSLIVKLQELESKF